ncbi:MAG: hypothetical protein RRA63_05865 [Candidatus Calescibacterium sp.]|jgi:hypothetical protein|nr:hypothetical protein [Candidatus Calescibacterium sp.]
MDIRDIVEKAKLDRRTKNFIKLNLAIIAISLIIFFSIKVNTKKKFEPQIKSLKKSIEDESKKVEGDMKTLKENLHKLRQNHSSWEMSKNKTADIYSLLLRTSKVSSKNISLEELEIIPEDTKINFLIKGQAKELQNANNFSKRLSKKRGEFLVRTEIVNMKNSEDEKVSFILKGQAWSTKNEKQENKKRITNVEEIIGEKRKGNEIMKNTEDENIKEDE